MGRGGRAILFLAGLLLVPFCIAATQTTLDLVRAAQPPGGGWLPLPALALAGGFALWLVLWVAIPRPVRAYILAHELTHALWGALMGARILRLRVSRRSGSVALSKENVFITLAPYFFPLYTVLIIAAYYALALLVEVESWHNVWLILVGFTWGFHATFTVSALMLKQSDILAYGRLFSYALIYLLNALGICLWIVLVSRATLPDLAASLRARGEAVADRFWDAAAWTARLRTQYPTGFAR